MDTSTVNWLEIATAISAVLAGSVVQGAVGFGLALVSAPVLILIDPRFIPAPLLLASLSLILLTAYRDRQGIDLSGLRWAVIGRLFGTGVGVVALTMISGSQLTLTFGVIVLVSVGLSASGLHLRPNPIPLIGAGTVSGFMATTSSIGGPPMALLYQHESGTRLRGTLAGFFIVGVSISLVSLALIGRLGQEELKLALILQPGILIGFAASSKAIDWLDGGHTRLAVLTVAAVMACVVILNELYN
ncbi:MAG TPA: sulfite exporter TauE/SafE family protein [Acidobacteria bacterium]|nr:sulfite exporter TauE/SafE family protein [Acidobacteriota bacterium]HIN70736.1 sulfite exporter TauE/SafE family protein [Acidobacteriota bacterium]